MQGRAGMRCAEQGWDEMCRAGLKCRVVKGWGVGDPSSKTNRLLHAHLSIYLSIYLT